MKKSILFIGAICLFGLDGYSQLSPVELGRASNALTSLRTEQNQVYANDASGTVAFIHRQDVTIWGGGGSASGKLRYDISTNAGTSFSNDIGVLNSVYVNPARYPQLTGGPEGLIWMAPNIIAGNWDGFVSGLSNAATSSGSLFTTENYNEVGDDAYLTGGLCPGLAGEYWTASRNYNSVMGLGDSLYIYKGLYNASNSNVDWMKHKALFLNPYLGYDGNAHFTDPITSFSPDGQTGWVGLIGDMVGGSDTTYNPIFVHSTDGGATWGTPMEVDLRTVNYLSDSTSIMDELKYLWVDAQSDPVSTGKPTCSFEFDMTVDAFGNPHFFVVVQSASTTVFPAASYSVYPGLVKLAIDVFTEDGGATWHAVKVAPIYTFRGEFGTPDPSTGNLILMDNYPQISRTADGSHVFYSWVDSDTTVVGFGESDNLVPNLRIAGRRTSDGFMTCPKWITNNDFIWDGRALWPTMAPEVLTDGGIYKLPIVITEMITNDQNQPCRYWYFGNEATISDAEFIAHSSNLNSDNCTMVTPVSADADAPMSEDRIKVYPVPSTDLVNVVDLNPELDYRLELINTLGQTVLSTQLKGQSRTQLRVSSLPAGIYQLRIASNNRMDLRSIIIAN